MKLQHDIITRSSLMLGRLRDGWKRIRLLGGFKDGLESIKSWLHRKTHDFKLDRKYINSLSEISGMLQSGIDATENRFIELGDELESVDEKAKRLIHLTQGVVNSINTDSGDGFLSHIESLSRQTLEKITECRDEIRKNLQTIHTVIEYTQSLLNTSRVMDQTGLSLHVVGLNIAVESARNRDSSDMFSLFVKETNEIAEQMGSISEKIRRDCEKTTEFSATAQQDIQSGLNVMDNICCQAEQTVIETTGRINDMMEKALTTLDKLRDHSAAVTDTVGDIVVLIQYHDIGKQQIEHIVSSITEAVDPVDENESEDASLYHARIYKLLCLQSAQLEQVITEMRNVYQGCIQAFQELGNRIDSLIRNAGVLELFKENDLDTENEFHRFQANLKTLIRYITEGGKLKLIIGKIAEHISRTSTNLAEQIEAVHAIRFNLHLKSLNAVIKATRLDDKGRALEVLALEVQKISNQSDEFIGKTVEILNSFVSMGLDMEFETMREREMIEDEQQRLSDSMDKTLEYMNAAFESCREAAESSVVLANELKSTVSSIEHDLRFIPEFVDLLVVEHRRLNEIIDAFSSRVFVDTEDGLNRELESAASRYTMELERNVHGDFIRSPHEESDHNGFFPESSENEESEDDLDDNVELF